MTRWLVRSKQPIIIIDWSDLKDDRSWHLLRAAIYGRRMQIELSFRDLKSHRYGQGFEDSLTRKGARIEVLLLLSAMTAFASWLVGMAYETCGIDAWLTPFRSKRRLYSVMRLGREALVRRWSCVSLSALVDQLRHPSQKLLDQLGVPS